MRAFLSASRDRSDRIIGAKYYTTVGGRISEEDLAKISGGREDYLSKGLSAFAKISSLVISVTIELSRASFFSFLSLILFDNVGHRRGESKSRQTYRV